MGKKLTIEEINRRISEKRNDIAFFDASTFKNVDIKAKFIHKVHGEWWNTPYRIMKGTLHPKDARQRTICAHILPIEEIVRRVTEVHGYIITMDTTTYKGTRKEAIFNDIEYGKFSSNVWSVLKGSGHPKRGRKNATQKLLLTMDEIKKRLPDYIKIVEESFVSLNRECFFVDIEFGKYSTKPAYVLKGGGFHFQRASKNQGDSQRTPLSEIEKTLEKYNPGIKIVYETYTNFLKIATFIDPFYGEWSAIPRNVFRGSVHPKREQEKRKNTCLKIYKVDSPSKNREVFLKITRSSNLTTIKTHWKTGEELVCKASYECKVVDYLNDKKIDFEWQPKMFIMPNGRGYIPDLYLTNRDVWVEIKGWMRPVGKEKWDWFKSEHPTSELWDKPRLKKMRIL